MAINLHTKYEPTLSKRFTLESKTDAYAGKKFDFDGMRSIIVSTADKVTINDYNRSASSNRFGTPAELGDTNQTLTMSQDKSFIFAVDAGNASDQQYIKKVNDIITTAWDEQCVPLVDIYRFGKWANGAGLGAVNSTALTSSTVLSAIMTGGAAMSNKLVPKKNRVLFIAETVYIAAKLASTVLYNDKLTEDAISRGVVGYLDGMEVVPVPDSYLPTGMNFMIKYKDATVDPMKLKHLSVYKDPQDIDGELGRCRFYHDSFVLDNYVNGIYCHAQTGMLAAPTLTNSSNTVTFACTNSTGIKYTVDGSNPKTSATATTVLAAAYSTGVSLTSGQTMRAYAYASGYTNSPISETAYA